MSQYPEPAPYGASGAYGGGPAPRRRTRPSARWFVVAAVLLVLGAGLAISSIVLSVAAFSRVEARVPADGVTRTLQVEPDTAYLLWTRPTQAARCDVVDGASHTELPLASLGATSYSRDFGGGPWEGAATFVAESPTVEVTCSPGGSATEIGEKPRIHTLVGGILLGLVLPILLAVGAVIMLIVVGVLYATGAKPQHQTD